MIRQRVRIRFHKHSDLRLIGHRDLVRTFERLFRRAGLSLSMTEGYHPRAKMNFPSALPMGIEGSDEVMELELTHRVSPSLTELLNRHAPPGLTILHSEPREPSAPKAQPRRFEYELDIPDERRSLVETAVSRLLARLHVPIPRIGSGKTVDLRADLESAQLVDGVLRFVQKATTAVSARPRDLLKWLGIADLELEGRWLKRTRVELA